LKTIGNFSKIEDADGLTKLLATFFKFNRLPMASKINFNLHQRSFYYSAPLFDIMLDVSDDGSDAPFALKLVPPLSQHRILDASVNVNSAKCFLETKPKEKPVIDLELNYERFKECKVGAD
jgi:hypothetical protein